MSAPLSAEEIFHSARAMPDPEERSRFLDDACGGDASLRALVESLLAADAEAGAFLRSVAGSSGSAFRLAQDAASRDVTGDVLGRYAILQQIGEGGFGVVYMAEQREPVRRRVALKVIKLGMDTRQVIGRFEAERQALAMMDHPNIATVLDAGSTETGRPYFVMEYINGVSITEYCNAADLDTKERLGLFIQVCHAIQHAHQKGVIHRDIKPSNVLITLHDGVPVPKVIDFGIAKATGAELTARTFFTEHRQMIGTPAYMSPEQAEMSGLDIDTRSDIYSLGVLLYELLTSTTPFDSKDLLREGLSGMMRTIREVEPEAPSMRLSSLSKAVTITAGQRRAIGAGQLGRTLRGDLDCIVMKCLEKDRKRRYETAAELAQDVRRHLDGEPILAAPPSQYYRLKKFVRRHRRLVVAACAVALALLVGIVGTTIGLLQARGARFDADRRADEARAASADADRERAQARSQAYSASLFSASDLLARGQMSSARQYLEAAPEELRGWEWRHLTSRLDASLRTLEHGAPISKLLVAPDGASYYELGPDPERTIQHRDLATGRLLRSAATGGSCLMAWRLGDGPHLAMWLGTAPDLLQSIAFEVWDLENGARLSTWPITDGGILHAAGHLVACLAADGLSLRDVATGEVRARVVAPSGRADFWELDACLRPDARLLAVEAPVGGVRLIDVASQRLLSEFPMHADAISGMVFSPDGHLLGTGSSDGTVRVADLTSTPPRLSAPLRGHFGRITDLSFSADGTLLLTSSTDGTVRAWDLRAETATGVLETQVFAPIAAAFLPDGHGVITGDASGRVRFWDARAEEARLLHGHASYVYSALVSPDGSTIYSGGWDGFVGRTGSLRIWDAASGEPIGEWGSADQWIVAMALSRDGSRLALAVISEVAGWLEILDASTGRTQVSIPALAPPAARASLLSLAFDPSGERIAWLDDAGVVVISDARTGADLATRRLAGNDRRFPRLAWSTDGSMIATCHGSAAMMSLWDGVTLEPVRSWPIGSQGTSQGLAFSADGRRLVSFGEDGVARVWDAETGERLGELVAGGSALLCAAFSPDGRRLAIGSFDGRVWLWDAESFEPVARLVGHSDYVFSVGWTTDSKTLITSSGDHSVRLWETRPLRDRLQARRARQQIVAQVQPVVHGLFREGGDAGRVLDAVRADARWTGRARQVALQVVLAESLRAPSSAGVTAPTGAAGPWGAPQRR